VKLHRGRRQLFARQFWQRQGQNTRTGTFKPMTERTSPAPCRAPDG
jgi:hypothetical protein